jgi:hypothetical protein
MAVVGVTLKFEVGDSRHSPDYQASNHSTNVYTITILIAPFDL